MVTVMLRWARVAAAMLVLALAASIGRAEDVVTLKSGETVSGEIVRELEGHVWIRVFIGSIGQERFIAADDIAGIERDVSRPGSGSGAGAGPGSGAGAGRLGVTTKAAVISLEGTVGIQMTADTLRELIPMLEADLGSDRSGVVVFLVNSGGGLLLEIQKLSDVIHNEYKQKFRVVAWIESAISAAAMTAHAIEEIYFMPQGNYGACTGWFDEGRLTAVSGLEYQRVLVMMEAISARGGYDHRLMKAMQGHPEESNFEASWPLSASLLANGKIEYYQDEDSGQFVVNPVGEVLTLNASTAERVQFSDGTARSIDELERLLNVGEIEWVGESYPGRIYPVSPAEKRMIQFRERVTRDEVLFNERLVNYQITIGAAQQAQGEARGRIVGLARQNLSAIVGLVRRYPNFGLMLGFLDFETFRREYVEPQEALIRELARN